jgi:catechol 2,3-dioxygenase-like lactoylglutathione lyase family enzyme
MTSAFIMTFDPVEGDRAEAYDKVMADMGLGGSVPEGAIRHYAGPYEGGWRVIDVWADEAAFGRFAQEQIGPPQIEDLELHSAPAWLRSQAMGVIGLDHVQIAAPPGAEAAAREFYGGWLGLPEIPKPQALAATGGVWFTCGAQELHVGIETGFAPAGKAHPGFAVEDLDTLVAGRDVTWDDRIPGVRRCYVSDPFGNRIELRAA